MRRNEQGSKIRKKLAHIVASTFAVIFAILLVIIILISIKLVKNYIFIKATGLDKMAEQQKNFDKDKMMSEMDEKLKIYEDTELDNIIE